MCLSVKGRSSGNMFVKMAHCNKYDYNQKWWFDAGYIRLRIEPVNETGIAGRSAKKDFAGKRQGLFNYCIKTDPYTKEDASFINDMANFKWTEKPFGSKKTMRYRVMFGPCPSLGFGRLVDYLD